MAAKKDPSGHPEELLALYDQLIATLPEQKRKGKANPYTSHNGHMFTFLDKNGKLSLRFSQEDQEVFIKKHKAELSIQHGSVMRGYAVIPDKMMTFKKLKPYFELSYNYINSIEPKATSKKKK